MRRRRRGSEHAEAFICCDYWHIQKKYDFSQMLNGLKLDGKYVWEHKFENIALNKRKIGRTN